MDIDKINVIEMIIFWTIICIIVYTTFIVSLLKIINN